MTMFLIAILAGMGIGICSGLLGIGGGTIMVPVFHLAFGFSPTVSTGTSLFTIIPTSASGAIAHLRNKTCIPKLGLFLGVGGACTSPLGVLLAHESPGWLVMALTGLVIAYSAFTMLRKALAKESAGGSDDAGAYSVSFPKAFLIGAATGIASGYVGLGGGFIMVPLMMRWLGMPMRLTSGTSLVAMVILALPGTIAQCMLGNVDYLVGIATACGSIPGALIGARLVPHVPERALRLVFAGFLILAALMLIVRG